MHHNPTYSQCYISQHGLGRVCKLCEPPIPTRALLSKTSTKDPFESRSRRFCLVNSFSFSFHVPWVPSVATMEPDSTYIGWKAIVVSALFIPIQVVFVVLRFWAQRLSRKSYDWDDWLVIASLLTQIVASALGIGKWSRAWAWSLVRSNHICLL